MDNVGMTPAQQPSKVMPMMVGILVGIVIGAGVYWWYQQIRPITITSTTALTTTSASVSTAPISQLKTLAKGDFGDAGEYGTLQAEGYATTIVSDDGFCQENCKLFNYIYFNITRTENANILNYIKGLSGNSFVQDKAVGMGCLADGQISYYNDSDAKSEAQHILSKDDTTKIMAATADKPIVLQLERLKFTGGSGAPTCYSHFTTFKVINS